MKQPQESVSDSKRNVLKTFVAWHSPTLILQKAKKLRNKVLGVSLRTIKIANTLKGMSSTEKAGSYWKPNPAKKNEMIKDF